MILRNAFLVCVSQNGQPDPRIEMTRNFLMSPRGGGWSESEIGVLTNPLLPELLQQVKHKPADYSVIFFYGPSFSDQNNKRFLVLGEGDFFEDTELLNESKKQLVIVDSGQDTTTIQEDLEVYQFDGGPKELSASRKVYDKWIASTGPGRLILHGAGEAGTERLFTRKLMQLVRNLPSMENTFNLKSILAASMEAPRSGKTDGELPGISYESGDTSLPFAMAMPVFRKGKVSDSGFTGLAMAVFLIGLLLSGD